MKNFSEATVIKPELKLKMVLELKAIGICPCRITINNQLEFYGGMIGTTIFIKHIPISDPININIDINRQHPQAIEIISLTVDHHEILPVYLSSANPPTNYLDFTGGWTINIPNFYPWYHEITGQGWII